MSSKELMKEVVDSLRLGTAYYQIGHFKKREIYNRTPIFVHVSNPKDWGTFKLDRIDNSTFSIIDKEKSFSQTFQIDKKIDSPYGELSFSANPFGSDLYPIEVRIKNPRDLPTVSVSPINKRSSIVYLNINTSVPAKGINIIETLIGIYNRQNKEEKNQEAWQTIRFIDDRLPTISKELEQAEKAAENYKRSNDLTDISTEAQSLLLSTNDYAKQGAEVETQLSILAMLQNFLASSENEGKVAPANVGLTDPTVLALMRIYNEEILEKNKNTLGVAATNPLVQEYDKRIALMKLSLLEGITISESSLHLSLMKIYKQEIESSEKKQNFSTHERNWGHLFREKKLKERLFTYLLLRKEETVMSLDMATPGVIVVDEVEYGLVALKISQVLLIALAIGLIIPFCFIFIRALFDNKLRDEEQLIKTVKAPFLGSVPFCNTNQAFPASNLLSRIAEDFGIINSNLYFILSGSEPKALMVTSSCYGEGKSFFSQNLAMSLATLGKKTLLMDTDMRKSTLSKTLKINQDKDFSLFLADTDIDYSQIINKTASCHKNLDIIPVKIFPPNPSEILDSKRLDMLFDTLRKEYDYIIVDTAPIGLVADAFRINSFVDASIFVTRAHFTPKTSLEEIQELYKSKKLHNFCMIINAIQTSD